MYRTLNGNDYQTQWICECSCGNVKPVTTKSLLDGASVSCGCLRQKHKNMNDEHRMRVRDKNNSIIKKKCFRCNKMLPISNFYKSSHQFDGYSGECKQCSSENESNRYNNYRKGAKRRKINFQITKQEFHDITSKECWYCGEYSKKDLNGVPYNGIDRVDSSIGYIAQNIVPCCAICNRMKLDHDLDKFLNHLNKIINYQKENKEWKTS